MMDAAHTTGTVTSGDVTIFYRHFGTAAKTPLLILHGANYFDSADWIEVGQSLAADREVVAIDQRGFGKSGWSSSKNYSDDAHIRDILAVLDQLGWERAIIMGHSRGGLHAILFASRLSGRTAGLILADSAPGGGPPPATGPSVNNAPRVFPTIEALQASLSRDRNTPPGSPALARLLSFTKPVGGGFILARRDPDFANTIPLHPADWAPAYQARDMWAELAAVRAPVMLLRGTLSDRLTPASFDRIGTGFRHIAIRDIESGHDMAAMAPMQLAMAVRDFCTHVDTNETTHNPKNGKSSGKS